MDFMAYSLKLEYAFCAFGNSCGVSAGGFRSNFKEMLREGFEFLRLLGVLDKKDKEILLQKYNFPENKLEDILSNKRFKEDIDELLNQLHAWFKVYTEED